MNLEPLWDDLASGDSRKAHQAVTALSTAPPQATALLRQHLRPAAAADARRIARLIADLDSSEFAVRQQASNELEKLGNPIVPALEHALTGQPSPEVRNRVKQLLDKLQSAAGQPEQLRLLRAIEVLEAIGTADAGAVLQTLAKGAPGARLTQEAQAAWQRLGKRSAATP